MKDAMSINLKYWDGRGLMEVPRLMLALAGKEYKDVRVGEGEGKTALSAIGDLSANLGRVPICETPAGSIGQSGAINFYVASECGLMGSSTLEAAQILAFAEHIKELMDAYRKLMPWGVEPTPEALAAFFDLAEATDFTGPADGSTRSARNLRWYMGRMEHLVGSDGFAVGGKFSLADVLLFALLGDVLSADMAPPELPAFRREPLSNLDKATAALAAHPKIKAIVDNVAGNAGVKKWLASRGKQGF